MSENGSTSDTLTADLLEWTRAFTGVDVAAPPVGPPGATAGDAGAALAAPAPSPAFAPAPAPAAGGPGGSAAPGGPGGPPASKTPAKQTPAKAVPPPVQAPAEDEAALVKKLADRIPAQVDIFLSLWLAAVGQAVDEVPPPKVDDPSGTTNFYRAMGGNLLWAATSLFPEWQPIVIAMSFMGAAIGTGVGADPATGQPPSPTKAVHDIVNAARDALSGRFRAQAAKIAGDIVKAGARGVDAEDRALWDRIFVKKEFDKIGPLKAEALRIVTSAVKQYTDQWNAWIARTNSEADRRTAKILTQTAGGRMPAGFPQAVRSGQLKQVRADNSFSPTLTFQ